MNVRTKLSGFGDIVYIFLVSVLLLEEKEQLSGVTVASTLRGLISVVITVVSGGRILAEGKLTKYLSM